MEWPLETRIKLARMVKEKSLGIQEHEFKIARGTGKTYSDILEKIDNKILETLKPLGFQRANNDWEHESFPDVMIFKDSPTTLWFTTAQGRVVKIRKEQAEKLLVLGFP